MTVFAPTATNPIIPSTNNYIRITLDANNNDITLTYPESFVPRKDYMAPFIEVYLAEAFVGGKISFDDTALTSFGNGCIISNIGEQNFKLYDFEDNELVDIAPGKQYVMFIGKDASDAPVWRSYLLGAGTSAANANSLAGYGLTAYNGKLNSTVPSINDNTPITIDNTVTSSLINWTGGSITINLDPSSFTPVAGFYFYIRNSSTTNGIITLAALSGSTIDGESNLLLNQNQSCIIIYDNELGDWKTVGLGLTGSSSGFQPSQFGVRVIDGTALLPSYSFIQFPNLGFYTAGDEDVSFSSTGVRQLYFDNTGINLLSDNRYKQNDDDILYLMGIYP